MTTPIQGQQFGSEEKKILEGMTEHWRKVWNEAPVQAIARVEDAAKQMIVVTTGLQGLYLAIFVFSTIRAQVMASPSGILGILILLLFCLPVGCWLMSMYDATRVFVPRVQPEVNFNEVSESAWQKVKETYGRVGEKKLHWLHSSHRWLIASFVIVLIAIVCLLFFPGAPTGPKQIIIVTPTPAVIPTP
jgi:hypothetical protein